jgi:hypothetical protein
MQQHGSAAAPAPPPARKTMQCAVCGIEARRHAPLDVPMLLMKRTRLRSTPAAAQIFYELFGRPEGPVEWKEEAYFLRDPFSARRRLLLCGARCACCGRDVCAARCAPCALTWPQLRPQLGRTEASKRRMRAAVLAPDAC